MTPERWQQVDKIFQAAIELSTDERAAFLQSSCGGDEELRREVELLISSDAEGLSLIDAPAFETAVDLVASHSPELKEGQRLGRYQIHSLLGAGGMGEVYLAEDTELRRKIAIKLLPSEYTKHQDRLRRFQQEARAASALNHPNILTIHELGQIDGQQFIATEFVEGETLRDRLKRPLSLSEILEITIQIAGALAAAHKAGIVHRDIKPENIMLRQDGYVKVLDFGLAKLTEQTDPAIQVSGAGDVNLSSGLVMGTVKYMSPEQARGQQVDPRSDIFSFGIVLYEMVAGHPPFEGKNFQDLITAILKKEPAPLNNAPTEIQGIIGKALRKSKEERYQTINDLLADLKSLKDDKGGGVSGNGSDTLNVNRRARTTGAMPAISTAMTLEFVVSGIKRHKTSTGLIVASFVVVAIGVAIALNRFGLKLRGPSRDVKITRVPDLDKAASVTISPNGQFIAYAEGSGPGKPNAGQSLWVLDVATNQRMQIEPPADIFYSGLTYSPNGQEIFYNHKEVIYKIPAVGGEASKVLSDVSGAISFSPDGAQFAFVRVVNPAGRGIGDQTALMVANADGSGERVVTTRNKPQFFNPEGPAWSPDGNVIVCASGELAKNNHGQLIGVDARTGEQRWASEARWDEFSGRILWLPDGSGLITAASQGADEQIWEIPYLTAMPHRITNDPNHSYWDLSLSSDGKSLITIERGTRSAIWIAPDGNPGAAKPITSGENHIYRSVTWTPDGRILYNSNIGNSRDIWIMNADGTNPKQLTNAGINMQPAASSDGRYVVYSSNRAQNGAYNVWRMDIDGSNPVQLTHGSGEGQPICSPDGLSVVYSQGGPSSTPWEKTLWKISIDGGESVQLTDKPSAGPSISPDGALIACWYAQEAGTEGSRPPLKIALIPFAGGEPIKVLDARWVPPPNRVRWTVDGQKISFVNTRAGITNIWNQPMRGGPPEQLTQFTSEQIDGFDWSRDGQLVCARLHGVSDVMLISDFR